MRTISALDRWVFGGLRGGAAGDAISALFADGTTGFDYDFSDPAALAVSGSRAEGAVSAPNTEIGFAWDRHAWQGRRIAEQLAATGEVLQSADFSAATGWANGSSGSGVASIAGGILTLETLDSSNRGWLQQSRTVTNGAWYRLSAEALTLTGSMNMRLTTASFGTTPLNAIYTAPGHLIAAVKATATTMWFQLAFLNAGSATIDWASLKAMPGFPAQQTTNNLRPFWQSGGGITFDGTPVGNRHLLSEQVAGPGANTLIAQVGVPSSLPNVQWIAGTAGASGGALAIGINTSGRVVAAVGDQTETTIVGTSDLRGQLVTLAVVADGDDVALSVNGAVEYSGAQAGVPNTTVPFRIGARNNNGTGAGFYKGSLFRCALAHKAVA
jgi:hypothetical protein